MNDGNWTMIKCLGAEQIARWCWCRGCKHLSSAGQFGCCNYLLDTGKIRPCKAGFGCTEREYIDGFVMPEDHAEMIRAVEKKQKDDAEYNELFQYMVKRFSRNSNTYMELNRIADTLTGLPKRGRKRVWDEVYACYLYKHGYSADAIRQIVKVPKHQDIDKIVKEEWAKLFKPQKAAAVDVREEKVKYDALQFVAQKRGVTYMIDLRE